MIEAPELPLDPNVWLNTGGRSLNWAALHGRVVLLAFWAASNIASRDLLVDLAAVQREFIGRPLTLIGIHSGKFDGERTLHSVAHAVNRLAVPFPVVRDSNFGAWRSYGVTNWPTVLLVDPRGGFLGDVSGDPSPEHLTQIIGRLLEMYRAENLLASMPLELTSEPLLTPESTPALSPLAYPTKIVCDAETGRLFISDTGHNRIVVCDLNGERAFAIGSGKSGSRDGAFAAATFAAPEGIALFHNALTICDRGGALLRCADMSTGRVAVIAGTGERGHRYSRGGKASHVALASPSDVCWVSDDGGDYAFIAMAGTHQIWRYDPLSSEVSIFAGVGSEAHLDGPCIAAAFANPTGIANSGADIVVIDAETGSIRKLNVSAGSPGVTTLAGGDQFDFGDCDGEGSLARFQHPVGICAAGGDIYIADTYNCKIKRYRNGVVESLFGSGVAGMKDGNASEAMFDEPRGLCVLGDTCYIADTNNHAIRAASLTTGAVTTLSVAPIRLSR